MTLLAGTTPGGFFARIETVPAQLEAIPFPKTGSALRRLGMLGDEASRGDKGRQGTPPEFRRPYTTIGSEKEAELLDQAIELQEQFHRITKLCHKRELGNTQQLNGL